MDQEIVIRPYEPTDREAVRHICWVTGYMGEPAAWMWRDEKSFADLFSSYYTDGEPESALVAVADGVVSGYLLGCVDTRKVWRPSRIFFHHVLRRGIAFRPGTSAMILRSFTDGFVDRMRNQLPTESFNDKRWPAHLHIDLMSSVRGQGVGAKLIRRWLDSLRAKGVKGCHIETLGENERALAFFEAMGFERYGRPAMAPGLRSPSGERHTVQLLVQSLE